MTIDEIFHIIDGPFRNFEQKAVMDSLLDGKEYSTPRELKEAILKSEKENQETAATACEMFARENRWPTELTAPRFLLISNRLREAHTFLQLCQIHQDHFGVCPIQFAPEASRKDILEFLLLAYWSSVGRERWLSRMTYFLV